MRLPMMARSIGPLRLLSVAGALLLSACTADLSPTGLAPADAAFSKGIDKHFSKKDIKNGGLDSGEVQTFVFTIKPGQDNSLDMGLEMLTLPAGSICDAKSGYGPGSWDKPCSLETLPVTITATVTGTAGFPRIDFEPAMRFNPDRAVELFMYAPHASSADASNFNILYCASEAPEKCKDEAGSDASLTTRFSRRDNEVFRRIKHFSGYVVAERDGGEEISGY